MALRVLLAAADAALINLSVYVGLLVRFNGHIPAHYFWLYFPRVALARAALGLVVFNLGGLYRGLWRYASIRELVQVFEVVTINSVPFIIAGFAGLLHGFPRSVVLLSWVLDVILLGGVRLTARLQMEHRGAVPPRSTDPAVRRVLIVGAGQAGMLVARELQRRAERKYQPVGLIDDDPAKRRMRVAGLEVLGGRGDLPRLIQRLDVQDVIVAMPSAPAEVIREIYDTCGSRVRLRTLPGMYEVIDGQVSAAQIRDVQIEDLLGRQPVHVDLDEIALYLRDERVLITGGGGSIGSELCRQIARFGPSSLFVLGNEENAIFEVQQELQFRHPALALTPLIANIRDECRMRQIFQQVRPTVVFHAAAHKHVPLMEQHPHEAVKNNVTGTRICAQMAVSYGAKRFVLISTDKAVNPTSVMGATKRVAELICRYHNDIGDTRFVAVRFGNVLGSRGSVLPLFRQQLARGGPLTVTHPDMERYFMTIPEAVALVIQAGAMGRGGEICVLDMGRPVRIVDLARNLIRLSGLEVDRDVRIVFTGVRPGEKMCEEVLSAEEGTKSTRHSRIFVALSDEISSTFWEDLTGLEAVANTASAPETLLACLARLVPTYSPTWPAAPGKVVAVRDESRWGVGYDKTPAEGKM